MPIAECPHCIQTVFFKEDGICPSCRKSKNVSPGQDREEILYQQEKIKLEEQFGYTRRKSVRMLIGSSSLFLISFIITIWFAINSHMILLLYGGIIAGGAGIIRGIQLFKTSKSLKKELKANYRS